MKWLAAMLLLAVTAGGAVAQVRIVGGPAGGCIAGAVELPDDGPGFQTIRASHSFYWGHPATISALELLAQRAQAAGLPDLYMNDISKRRGGPFPGVHASHMLGLDADVWLDVLPKPRLTVQQRDNLEVASLVRPDGRGVDLARWSPMHLTLIRLATTLPGVDRVLVNAAIKKQLCTEATGDHSWLHVVRPWYGHASHMHIHFRCPPGQPECIDQAPAPAGDGCDQSLAWWFERLDAPKAPAAPAAPPRPVVLPAACSAIMAR
jgi:penicillin-insensitive murein endopeptidase